MESTKQNVPSASPQVAEEYVVKIPRDKQKRFNIMRFNHSMKMDVTTWKQVKMERENNYKEFKLDNEDAPKYGAGSEFGRDLREEARRKKHGIISKKYNPDDQPWILKLGGKTGKKYKGIREGGVTENASYYVFTQAMDRTFEAYPVEEWYNFTPIQCYKALSPEEAEEAYGRREKVFNYFSIMTQKRIRADATNDDDEEKKAGSKSKKKKQQKDFKITDFDEVGNDLYSDGDSENEEEMDSKPSKKKPKKAPKKKKKKNDSDQDDDEPLEESDEGDFDDKEVDYMTNSSSSEEDVGEEEKTNRDLKGVEDEDALRKLMSEDEEEENPEENKEAEENTETKEKAAEAKPKQKPKKSDSSGESTSESSDSDFDDPKFTSAIFVPNFQKSKKKGGSDNSAGSSRANTPTKQHDKDGQRNAKRKFGDASSSTSKKQKMDSQNGHSSTSTLDGINEDTVRRYLQRKPMTAVELLHKFKSKKTKMSSQQLVQKIADVLKRMDLQKSNVKGKMYLSVKNT